MTFEPRYRSALGVLALTILSTTAFFLTWKTVSYDGVDGTATGFTSTVDTASGTVDGGSNTALVLFLVPLVGAALIVVPRAPRVGAVLTALTGLIVVWTGLAVMTGDTATVFAFEDADADLELLLDQAGTDGTVSTGAGLYLALVAGLLMIALGVFEFVRVQKQGPVAPVPEQQLPQHPDPYPGQSPQQPYYGPAHQPGWRGQYPPQQGNGPQYPPQQGGRPNR